MNKQLSLSLKYKSFLANRSERITKKINKLFTDLMKTGEEELSLVSSKDIVSSQGYKSKTKGHIKASFSAKPSLDAELGAEEIDENSFTESYQTKILKRFPFIEVMDKVKDVLVEEGFKFETVSNFV